MRLDQRENFCRPLLVFHPVSDADVQAAPCCSSSGAVGVDGSPIKLYKAFGSAVHDLAACLFNASLERAVFPSACKRALIRPLCKVNGSHDVADFRPISLLPVLSKVFERVVLAQLLEYLAQWRILDELQTGFRPGFGAQSAVTWFVDEVRRGVDGSRITVAVFLDFSKAFDSVVHAQLLSKLNAVGLSDLALRWVHSYLTGRSQAVEVNGRRSQWRDVVLGVPQGSVLGPLLYSLYVNDLPTALHHCSHVSFADDTVIWRQCFLEDLADCVELINEDLERLSAWGIRNNIRVNHSKSEAMILGSAGFISRLSAPPLVVVDGHGLQYSSSVKYLGVKIDSALSWGQQIAAVSGRVFGSLYRLKINDPILSSSLRRKLVVSLVLPHLDYCAVVLTN